MRLKNIVQFLKKETKRIKEQAIYNKMLDYYKTINQDKIAVPAFVLAKQDVEMVKKQGRVDELYRDLIRSM